MIARWLYRELGASPENADALADAAAIRAGLKTHDGVRMECFNRSEADRINGFLANEERVRVSFSWLFDDQSPPIPGTPRPPYGGKTGTP